MGSEHYCLRWNNHQSNLLGVFSQLLQDESLVDVTLACSEGAPIRAHKVVLSACSSYFQSLFLDHPERHPIVILKDVRFAELQTLVEFMYKGEVNVQYCQLSALLKTAESLKVKGLAEMTNQNTTLREPEREPDRLRPHSQPSKATCDSPVDAALAGSSTSSASSASPPGVTVATTNAAAATAATTSTATAAATTTTAHKRDASERCSPSPPKRLLTSAADDQNSPLPLDLYHRRTGESEESVKAETSNAPCHTSSSSNSDKTSQQNRSKTPLSGSGNGNGTSTAYKNGDEGELLDSPERPASCDSPGDAEVSTRLRHKLEEFVDDYDDEEMDLDDEGDNSSNEVGLNMKIGSSSGLTHAATARTMPSPLAGGGSGCCEPESARSTPGAATSGSVLPSDLTQRPASRSSRDGSATATTGSLLSGGIERPSSIGVCGLPSTSTSAAVGGLSSPSSSSAAAGVAHEAVAGTSGLGPVQSVPLSLKKEIDCSEDDNSNSRHMQPRSASASGVLGGDLDYRASHESETCESPHGGGGGGSSGGGNGSGGGGVTTTHDQPQTPPPLYPCMYCGATFSNQSKLTRHILSHSLKTLEFRETATHSLLPPHLLPPPHELNMGPLPQHLAYQMNAIAASGGDTQEQQQAAVVAAAAAAMEMENFAAAVAAAGGCAALTGMSGCGVRGGLDLDGSGGGCGGSRRDGGAGASSSSASAASTSAGLLGASNDPNSVVLCKFCGKSFPDVASLITHLPVHTGDRPFKCEFCGKAFKLRHHMKDHCRVHTGERPFRCHMCGKTFSRSTILKAHEKTHFPKYVRKYLSPSPVDTKDDIPQ